MASDIDALSEQDLPPRGLCGTPGYALPVEIRIGIVNVPREIAFESAQSVAEIEAAVSAALTGGAPQLSLADDKGKRYIIPTAGIAYVEIGSERSRGIGFVA